MLSSLSTSSGVNEVLLEKYVALGFAGISEAKASVEAVIANLKRSCFRRL